MDGQYDIEYFSFGLYKLKNMAIMINEIGIHHNRTLDYYLLSSSDK